MTDALPTTMRQLQTLVTGDGRLELFLADVEVPTPRDHEVLVRVEAAPINPSDLALLLAFNDLAEATAGGTAERPTLTAPVAPNVVAALAARVGQALPVGNEGCGTVVAAGSTPAAQALIGRRVGFFGGATYADYRAVNTAACIELPDGITPEQGASCFVNPFTALGLVETMRLDGHRALVHTAAASNLGQMLNRICLDDGVPLVNIVRRPEQAVLLRDQGATYVCDTSSETFREDLLAALVETGATILFDAIGGGKLVGDVLASMEVAASRNATEYNRYGSDVFKQAYIYGGLDRGPTVINRSFGFAWSLGGWLLTAFLGRVGLEGMVRIRERVLSELTTTFASNYTDIVSLAGALELDNVRRYAKQATGEKFLIRLDRD